jgi:hypothetical protein
MHTRKWLQRSAILGVLLISLHAAAAPAGAQQATPTPFRFTAPTPTPIRVTTTTTTAPAPRAGGFPMELALPALAGGLAAIGGGSYLLRRRPRA